MLRSCLSLSLLATAALANGSDKLEFVFEVVRHGARAPLINSDIHAFNVPPQMLTPSGMRQRYLLGTRNRQRYVEQLGLLSQDYDQSEIYVESTDVLRTLQSAESELLGLYPAGEGAKLSKKQ